jgi:hypothetical protein
LQGTFTYTYDDEGATEAAELWRGIEADEE